MAVETQGRVLEARMDELPDAMEDPTGKYPERNPLRNPLLWIGALSNPHVAPMVVLNETGYLVPLLTAGDLLRLCKNYWRRSHE